MAFWIRILAHFLLKNATDNRCLALNPPVLVLRLSKCLFWIAILARILLKNTIDNRFLALNPLLLVLRPSKCHFLPRFSAGDIATWTFTPLWITCVVSLHATLKRYASSQLHATLNNMRHFTTQNVLYESLFCLSKKNLPRSAEYDLSPPLFLTS